MAELTLLYGEAAEEENEVVISEELAETARKNPGDMLLLKINDRLTNVRVSGIARVFEEQIVYLSEEQFSCLVSESSTVCSVKVKLKTMGINSRNTIRDLETAMEERGVRTLNGQSRKELASSLSSHFAVTLNTFLVVSVLLVAVLAVGIAASLGLQMQERERESGILKAIGATEQQILSMLSMESLVFALIGSVCVWILGLPFVLLGCRFFSLFVLQNVFDMTGFAYLKAAGLWGLLCTGVIWISCRRPARQSAAKTIRETFS